MQGLGCCCLPALSVLLKEGVRFLCLIQGRDQTQGRDTTELLPCPLGFLVTSCGLSPLLPPSR